MRLDKFLANMGVGTRSEVKKLIGLGKVSVNGVTTKKINASVEASSDLVKVFGKVIGYSEHVYLMLNKPGGVISATEDAKVKTVIDLIDHPRKKQLFPVGRLDKDTEGLLVLTDDGQLAHRLLSPKKHVPKKYYARIQGTVTQAHVRAFREGLEVDTDFTAKPALLTVLAAGETSEIEVVITEGKFHQVKRMFEAVGTKVTYLKRLQMGDLKLDNQLKPGTWRELTQSELAMLEQTNIQSLGEISSPTVRHLDS